MRGLRIWRGCSRWCEKWCESERGLSGADDAEGFGVLKENEGAQGAVAGERDGEFAREGLVGFERAG